MQGTVDTRVGVRSATDAQAIIDKFPLERVTARFAADYDVPPEMATRVVEEMKRFLALCALHPSKPYGMRGIVDDAWHTFMLFSREYFAFCDALGDGFIHHEPEDNKFVPGEDPSERLRESRERYRLTIEDLESEFGYSPPNDIWPQLVTAEGLAEPACRNACGRSCSRCGRGCSSCGQGCSRCNRCGRG